MTDAGLTVLADLGLTDEYCPWARARYCSVLKALEQIADTVEFRDSGASLPDELGSLMIQGADRRLASFVCDLDGMIEEGAAPAPLGRSLAVAAGPEKVIPDADARMRFVSAPDAVAWRESGARKRSAKISHEDDEIIVAANEYARDFLIEVLGVDPGRVLLSPPAICSCRVPRISGFDQDLLCCVLVDGPGPAARHVARVALDAALDIWPDLCGMVTWRSSFGRDSDGAALDRYDLRRATSDLERAICLRQAKVAVIVSKSEGAADCVIEAGMGRASVVVPHLRGREVHRLPMANVAFYDPAYVEQIPGTMADVAAHAQDQRDVSGDCVSPCDCSVFKSNVIDLLRR